MEMKKRELQKEQNLMNFQMNGYAQYVVKEKTCLKYINSKNKKEIDK